MSHNWLEGFTEPIPSISGIELACGERIPKGFGVAWHMEDQDKIVVLPIPLNIVARAARNVYHRAVRGWCGDSVIDAAWVRGHHSASRKLRLRVNRAYEAGLRDGEFRALRILRDFR